MEVLFTLQTIVRHGHKRGKKLGFPTINDMVARTVPEGIYVSFAEINGKRHNALTFIGEAKTFNETDYLAETYILNFSEDLYGQAVTVSVLKKLRDNQKFATAQALQKQMEEDRRQAEAFFASDNF
ncbi:MAG: riboflavin kinase [Patescibacteria group bacterium]